MECDRYLVTGTQRFALTPDGLDHTVGVNNRAPWRVPVGLGIHPWFVLGPVRVPADETWHGEGPMPDGPPYPVPPELDLRTKRTPPLMDRCYCALTDTVAEIGDLTLSWDGPVTDVVVYTGTPGWVCVEPVTMATDAFRLAESGFDGTPDARHRHRRPRRGRHPVGHLPLRLGLTRRHLVTLASHRPIWSPTFSISRTDSDQIGAVRTATPERRRPP